MPQKKYGLSYADFYDHRSINVESTGSNLFTPCHSRFSRKYIDFLQENSYTKLHENTINVLTAVTKPQTDRRSVTIGCFPLLRENAGKRLFPSTTLNNRSSLWKRIS
jgi:hypothetical protein